MKKILDSNRIKLLEKIYTADITDLLYDLHYVRDFKHKQIARLLSISRPTITRWFRELSIPTRSCHRHTKKNLTSWLYKTGRLKKKVIDKGPDKRIQETKGNVDINFFKDWSPAMAYVLGFFAADGGMCINPRGSKYTQFTSTDKSILEKIKKLMHSNHKIGIKKSSLDNPRSKTCYLIQIGSKEIYNDLLKLGFTPKKDLTLNFPNVPTLCLSHFVRGHFDGDGCVSYGLYKRKNRRSKQSVISIKFACGNKNFLKKLQSVLKKYAHMKSACLYGRDNSNWLCYPKKDALSLFNYMYNGAAKESFLERKYNKFLKAIEFIS